MAYVLSSVSGNLISAASAGYAPTNSGEVSAIASAYQVVSSTATQLYAGTAHVTSINDAPISAARAGNAVNASMANSAYYDGTGRLISALPDEATVSAIASSYAESAASGKQDELTFSYDDDKISAINGSALAGQGGGEQVVTSLQYVVSEPTSKYELYQPAGTTGIDMSSNLLVLDDTAYGMGQYNLSGLSSFDLFMTGLDTNIFGYYSASVSAMIVKASASGRQPWEWSPSDTAFGGSLVSLKTGYSDYDQTGSARVSTQGISQYGSSWPDGTPFHIQPPYIFFTTGNSYQGTARIGTAYGSASYVNTAAGGESSVSGVNELPLYVEKDTSVSAIAEAYAQSAVSSVSGDYYPRYSNPSNFVQSADVVMRSSVGSSDKFITSINGTPFMATDSALATRVSDTASATAYQTAFVNFEADAASRSVFVSLPGPSTPYITAFDSYGGNVGYGSINLALDPDNYVYTGQYVVTSTAAVSAGIYSNYGFSASAICGYTVPLAHASALPTYQYDAEDKISAINGSAIAGGAGGVDSATVSAIASSYAESAVSAASSNYYTTANESGYALSSDVSGTVDLVSTQSANWGGSALALSAGPGVKLEKVGDTLVASTDETVLWSGSEWVSAAPTISLSGSVSSYDRIGIYAGGYGDTTQQDFKMVHFSAEDTGNGAPLNIQGIAGDYTVVRFNVGLVFPSANGSALRFVGFRQFNVGNSVATANTPAKIRRIVGINRTAEA